MSAVTIHLPAEVEDEVRRASAAAGMSVSAWLTDAARRHLADRPPPPEVTALFGAFPGFALPSRDEPWSSDP